MEIYKIDERDTVAVAIEELEKGRMYHHKDSTIIPECC